MAGGSFLSIIRVAMFLLAVWTAGKVSKWVNISTIPMEIAVGVVTGPKVSWGPLIPAQYSVCEAYTYFFEDCDLHLDPDYEPPSGAGHGSGSESGGSSSSRRLAGAGSIGADHSEECATDDMINRYGSKEECEVGKCRAAVLGQCSVTPDVMTLIGHLGVSICIFESGMHFDFDQVRVVGPKAVVFAILGTGMPILLAVLYTMILNTFRAEDNQFPIADSNGWDGLAAGVSLSPTSVGIALKLLMENQQLHKPFGQAIITAAFVDDILALMAYGVLMDIGTKPASADGGMDPMTILKPCFGVVFLITGAVLATKFWPGAIRMMTKSIKTDDHARFTSYDNALLYIMVVVLGSYATISHYLGSHLWGCFVAGMSFTGVFGAHHAWSSQTKKVTSWFLRLFFACTVAFAIPVKTLFKVSSFLMGLGMGAVPCVLSKVCCAPFMGDARWVVGWGMTGRAEFAYLIAQMAYASGLMAEEMFSIVIWSLLWATLTAPFMFKFTLKRYVQKQWEKEAENRAAAKQAASSALPPAMQHFETHDGEVSPRDPSRLGMSLANVKGGQHRWFSAGEGSSYRFLLSYMRETPLAGSDGVQLMKDYLKELGFEVDFVREQADERGHFAMYTISPGEAVDVHDAQERILEYCDNNSARVVFLPTVHDVGTSARWYKLQVICHREDAGVAGTTMQEIIKALEKRGLGVSRCSCELQGGHFYGVLFVSRSGVEGIADHKKHHPNDGSRTKLQTHEDRQSIPRQEVLDARDEILQEFSFKSQMDILIEGVEFDRGPLGEIKHDAVDLLNPLPRQQAFLVEFIVDTLPPELMQAFFEQTLSRGISVIALYVDEHAAVKLYSLILVAKETPDSQIHALRENFQYILTTVGAVGEVNMCVVNAPESPPEEGFFRSGHSPAARA